MAIKRFSSTFKTRNDVMDNITPNNVVQPHIANPAGEWKPARYLPVQWTGEASKDAFVISSGKVVCLDNTGRISDMNILAAARGLDVTNTVANFSTAVVTSSGTGTAGNPVITYDSTDVTYGVYDISTGAAAAAGAVFIDEIAQGLLDQGLVVLGRDLPAAPFTLAGVASRVDLFTDGVNVATDQEGLDNCLLVIGAFFSDPVGVAAYDVYCWAGDTPAELVFTNYQKQHLIQFLTQVQLRLPVIADEEATSLNISSSILTTASLLQKVAAGELLTNAQLLAIPRFASLGAKIQGVMLDPAGVCSNTDRTPFSDASGTLTKEKKSAALLSSDGDFFIDTESGVLLMYSDGGADWSAGIQASDFTTLGFNPKVGNAQQYRHVHMVGPCRPGDKLSYDDQSNFCVMASTEDAHEDGTSNTVSIGTVMEVIREPRGLLDRVETAFKGSSFSASAKMPGTATKGFSDMITLSGETVADELVTIIVRF